LRLTPVASPQIDSSTLSGTTAGVDGLRIGTRITNTRIVGGALDFDGAATNCRNTYDENLVDVSC